MGWSVRARHACVYGGGETYGSFLDFADSSIVFTRTFPTGGGRALRVRTRQDGYFSISPGLLSRATTDNVVNRIQVIGDSRTPNEAREKEKLARAHYTHTHNIALMVRACVFACARLTGRRR